MVKPSVNHICLQDSAIGFLLNSLMLYEKIYTLRETDFLKATRLQTPYTTSLLLSIELFFKVMLLNQGKSLDKLKTHKIHDLYKKLNPETRKHIELKIDHSGKHLDSLEMALAYNNDKSVRFRYNDLTESSALVFKYEDILLHLALSLYEVLGFKIKPDLSQYGTAVTRS